MKIGTRVDFHYTHPITRDRIIGSGVIVGDSVIIGTDYGYTVKRDSDGEPVEVRCTSCTPQYIPASAFAEREQPYRVLPVQAGPLS